MIGTFLLIRLKQIIRAVLGVGIIRMLILASVVFIIGLGIFVNSSYTPHVYVLSGLYFFILSYVHLKRKDKTFLKSRFNQYRLIFLTEYYIYSLPLITALAYHYQWITLASFCILIGLLSIIDIKPRIRKINTGFQRIIPNESFEWKAGSRRVMYYVVPLWIIGFATAFFVGSIPLIILIIGLIPVGFYDKGEPYQMLIAFETNAKNFLRMKLRIQIIIFSLMALPLMICFLFFHIEYWFIPLIEYALLIFVQIYFILAKYAFYEPNEKSSTAQLYGAFGALSIFIFFLIPFVWIMSVYFYIRANKKLNFWLHDFN